MKKHVVIIHVPFALIIMFMSIAIVLHILIQVMHMNFSYIHGLIIAIII